MSDLEDLWDDLPVGPAPVDAIVRRAARDPQRHRRRLRRSVLTVAAVGGVAAVFVAGTLVHQTDGPGGDAAGGADGVAGASDVAPAAFHGALNAPASCDALLRYYVGRAAGLVGPRGWERDLHLDDLDEPFATADQVRTPQNAGRALSRFTPAATPAPATQRQTDSATGTNVQEAGVDEPDIVKTDGTLLARVRDDVLSTYDVSGATVKPLGDLDLGRLGGAHDPELLLAGHTVVVLASTTASTQVETVDVSDPAHPAVTDVVDYDAGLAAARQTGTDVRLVLQSGLPPLDFVHPDVDHTTEEAKAANLQTVRDSTLRDWLPQLTAGGKTSGVLDCAHVAIPRADLSLGTMTVAGFDAASSDGVTRPHAVGLAGVAATTYASTDHLYLAASPSSPPVFARCFDCPIDYASPEPTSGDGRTYLYDFALRGADARYTAAGEVDGIVSDRWSMDEADGVLRVAVGASAQTGDFTSVVTFRRSGDQLLEIGRLDGLGRGEEMRSVRWFDGLALLVTYRRLDPLYAVDLTDQRHPRLIGELRVGGFSSYLQPLGSHRVIGMGEGPVRHGAIGARAGLFDTLHPTHLRRLDLIGYPPGSRPLAAVDARQFTWLPAERTAITMVQRGNTGYVSTLHLAGGRMTEHRSAAEYGDDIAGLRAVPVPARHGDGDRVVLVTGGTVSFLDLGLQ